jgi:DNA-binding transcriptional ArsR family regulator
MNVSKSHGAAVGELTIAHLERVARMLRLLAHSHRLKIVEALDVGGAQPVFELMGKIGLPQAATSQHLNLMRRAGLVEAERRGREIWYDIADRRCLGVLNCIREKRSAGG